MTTSPVDVFWERIREAVIPALEHLEKVWQEFTEALATAQERQTQRTHKELVTPPLDHTMSHVTHTGTKPPHPARIYRRRTP